MFAGKKYKKKKAKKWHASKKKGGKYSKKKKSGHKKYLKKKSSGGKKHKSGKYGKLSTMKLFLASPNRFVILPSFYQAKSQRKPRSTRKQWERLV